jgi:hypothetical protein
MKTRISSTKDDSPVTDAPVTGKSAPYLIPVLLLSILLVMGCSAKETPAPPPPPVAAAPPPAPAPGEDVVLAAKANLGVPYRYGGVSPKTGFDCSGLVCWSYEQVGVKVPRIARDQLKAGVKVESREQLLPGDIVVFKGMRSRTGWHSGIYSGNGKFVHSPSTGKTVRESTLLQGYFALRYVGGRRIPRTNEGAVQQASGKPENQKAQAVSAKAAQAASAPAGQAAPAQAKTKAAQSTTAKAKTTTKNHAADTAAQTAPTMTAQATISPKASGEAQAEGSHNAATGEAETARRAPGDRLGAGG